MPDAVSDEELEALAMPADPDRPIDRDAVPFSFSTERPDAVCCPTGTCPSASSPVRGRVRRTLVGGIVLALLVINGVGLCVTSGFVELAW